MSTPTQAADPALIDDLVTANHILFNEGVVDGFGHISVRHDKNPERFLLSRSLAPATVTAADILEYNVADGQPVDAQGRKSYLERFIHSEIYRTRPDVQSVIHSHSLAVIPFGITKAKLRPVCHMSGFLGFATPVYEIRDESGPDTNMLVQDNKQGAALAKVLGKAGFALMRGHGSVAVGKSIKQAVYRGIYAEVNARLQAEAMKLGEITFLTEGEAVNSSQANDDNVERPWLLWKKRAQESR
ncbi:MAG: class II aldolase/adducin family protein [Proteobacteria bacterium]|nr:class II aldolase/adducin family protein [Pseudomonadota bacterium]